MNAMRGAPGPAHVLVTGAAGFVGRALVARLLQAHAGGTWPLARLTTLDLTTALQGQPGAAAGLLHAIEGSIADAAVVQRAFAEPVDVVFHLASVPGGTAEQQYALGRDVNLHATLHLLEACAAQAQRGGPVPRFVFASTVGVFGAPLPPVVDDDTRPCPGMTYGAHKLMAEAAVADFTRRGGCDGLSLRLAGVLARPPAPTGQRSAFLSELLRAPAAGRDVVCPMSPQATTWASSTPNVVDNLLHAATVPAAALPRHRALTLPALRFSMAELVDALVARHGPAARAHVHFAPEPEIEALFGQQPPLHTPAARAAGFADDGDLATLLRRATEADRVEGDAP
jgi:nucleoside-diphosphate-sugar epimerase